MKFFRLLSCSAVLLWLSLPVTAQHSKPVKNLRVSSGTLPAAKAWFVAEIHGFYELEDFKLALVRYLQQNAAVNDVVLEIGHSMAYLMNEYMSSGDWSHFAAIGASDKLKLSLDRWRELYQEHPLTVHGIDFERIEFVAAAAHILGKQEKGKATALYQYLISITDTAAKISRSAEGADARSFLYEQARTRFEKEKKTLESSVTADFATLEAIFENPASEAHMKGRNKAMHQNINSAEVQHGRPFICILGASHQMLISGSVLSHYLDDHAGQVVLVKMLCKNCYTSTYTTTNHYFPFISALDVKKSQTELLEQAFDSMYHADEYTLIPEQVLLPDAEARKDVSVWYTLFKDQSKM